MDDSSDDELFDPDFDAQFDWDSEDDPGSTKRTKSSNGTFNGTGGRNGDKKSVDPFMPHPIKLRKFLEETAAVLDELIDSPEVREAREIHAAAQNAKTNGFTAGSRSGRQKSSHITVPSLVLNGFEVYQDDERVLREQHMQTVRRRVEASAVSFRESHSFSMTQHLQAAPELKTLRYMKLSENSVFLRI
ncbi:hypothetical protein RvY_11531 [Ramazzottius varieornatus]|uniref:Uncharacterized protein n=1 Tax=Ramazzottius varieornatus TaxID=947166 RepID=A0A1D1VGE9_RAMVA|nr:hypothetical protein RvY_11531 [Ramazzottius varieornatus]